MLFRSFILRLSSHCELCFVVNFILFTNTIFSSMAAPADALHRERLNRNIDLHEHFETEEARITNDVALARQGQLTPAHIAAQQNHRVAELGPGFLSPHYYVSGTLPQPDNPLATLVNGFGLHCQKHLIREDGTAVDPAFPPECTCGTWYFRAWGCDHNFCSHENVCGQTRASPTGKTRCCPNTKGVHHTARARVLGPCLDKGCAWWAEREDAIDDVGTFSAAQGNGHLRRVWRRLARDL
jgi:hypothetical protein